MPTPAALRVSSSELVAVFDQCTRASHDERAERARVTMPVPAGGLENSVRLVDGCALGNDVRIGLE
jgi:hypothetical protein